MEDIIKIDAGYDSYQDENLCYLDEFSGKGLNLQSGLIFVDKIEFDLNMKEARKKLSDPKNQSWGILESEVKSMLKEKEKLIKLFKEFYSSKISENPKFTNLTPHQLEYLIKKLLIRIKRMDCVLDTKYNSTEFVEKKTGHRYLMAKGFWIKEDGTRVRSISRSITNVESSIIEVVMKILKTNKKSITLMELDKTSVYKTDFIVFDGSRQLFVEVKNKNMDNMVKTFIMFETWKLYKSEYELLE